MLMSVHRTQHENPTVLSAQMWPRTLAGSAGLRALKLLRLYTGRLKYTSCPMVGRMLLDNLLPDIFSLFNVCVFAVAECACPWRTSSDSRCSATHAAANSVTRVCCDMVGRASASL